MVWLSFYLGAVLGVFLGLLIAGLLACARDDRAGGNHTENRVGDEPG